MKVANKSLKLPAWGLLFAFVCTQVVGSDLSGKETNPQHHEDNGAEISSAFGAWQNIPTSPIAGRYYPVSVWTGTEVIFYAGSNLRRDHAFIDGAAYNPGTDSWRLMPTPGWGNPGITGVFFDDYIYLLTKGKVYKLNPVDGSGYFLPPIDRLRAEKIVAGEQGIWVLGPMKGRNGENGGIGIAKLSVVQDEQGQWRYGTTIQKGNQANNIDIPSGALQVQYQGYSLNDQVVLWNEMSGRGHSYDTESESWSLIEKPLPKGRTVVDSKVMATERGLVAVTRTSGAGDDKTEISVLSNQRWNWTDISLPAIDLQQASIVPAGRWLIILLDGQSYLTVDLETESWTRNEERFLAYFELISAVWSGEQLIAWGYNEFFEDKANSTIAAIWTPNTLKQEFKHEN